MSSSRSVRSFLAIPAAALAVATMVLFYGAPVEAGDYKMSGKWLSRRGTAFIPLLAAKATTNPAMGTCLGGATNYCYLISGGIAGEGIAQMAGNGGVGAQVTIPQGAFDGNPMFLVNGTRNVFGLPANPTVIQVSTQFVFNGPKSDGVMKAGFAFTSPNGRQAADFTWCKGAAANPACTGPASSAMGGTGTGNGLVRYEAGTNAFGGTMRQVLGGAGDLSIKVGTGPLMVLHNVIGGGGGSQIFGGAYADTNSNALAGGAITVPGYTIGAGGLELKSGVNASTITGACPGGTPSGCLLHTGVQVNAGPSSTNVNNGFPFTTGMITAQVTLVAGSLPETFTTTGSDMRSGASGGGSMSLVAGGVTLRGSGSYYASLERVKVDFVSGGTGAPSMAPVGIVTITTLMALAGGFALRRRSSKKS